MLSRQAFSFVEVIACLMIIAGAIVTAIGLLQAGIRTGSEAVVNAMAEATAYSAIYDPDLRNKAVNGLWVAYASPSNPDAKVQFRNATVWDTLYAIDTMRTALPPKADITIAIIRP